MPFQKGWGERTDQSQSAACPPHPLSHTIDIAFGDWSCHHCFINFYEFINYRYEFYEPSCTRPVWNRSISSPKNRCNGSTEAERLTADRIDGLRYGTTEKSRKRPEILTKGLSGPMKIILQVSSIKSHNFCAYLNSKSYRYRYSATYYLIDYHCGTLNYKRINHGFMITPFFKWWKKILWSIPVRIFFSFAGVQYNDY
jgi:hypothetical protein